MKKTANAKKECLKINPKIYCATVKGTGFFQIRDGKGAYKPYSSYKDTPTLAWKDALERFNKQKATINPDAECGLCQKEIPEGDGYCMDCKGQI